MQFSAWPDLWNLMPLWWGSLEVSPRHHRGPWLIHWHYRECQKYKHILHCRQIKRMIILCVFESFILQSAAWWFLAILLKEKFWVGYHFLFSSRIESRFPQPHKASQSEATVILCLTSALLNKTFSCFGKHLYIPSTSRDPSSSLTVKRYSREKYWRFSNRHT